jgi:hypothetical protein
MKWRGHIFAIVANALSRSARGTACMSFISSEVDPPDQSGALVTEPSSEPIDPSNRNRDDMALFESGGAVRKLRLSQSASSTFGFLFPVAWFLYKKMYLQASVVVLLPIFLSLLHAPSAILRGVGLLISLFGAFGPRFHMAKARRLIAEIRAAAPDDAIARMTIGQAGGVSIAGAVLGALVTISVVMIAFVRA